MAKYSDIKGFTVQTLSSDPAASQFAGGSWASGGAVPTGAYSVLGFGTQTAAVAGGGYRGDPGYTAETFEYNGTSWSEGGDLTASPGQAREGHGVLTAGGVVAGYKTSGNAVINNYETYDGTSFTEQADLNTARQDVAATGSTTAALGVGGTTGVGPGSTQEGLTNVESYNGSSWTEITEVNTGRVRAVSFPGAHAPTMIFVGGSSDSTLYANVETYNGSAWTEITDLNTARSTLGGAGQAQTDGIVFGGSAPSKTGATENWNGTTWTELNDLSTARDALANAGTGAASALAAMGYSTQIETVTEEFTAPSTFQQTVEGQLFFNSTANAFKETVLDIPPTTWSSGGALNTSRYRAATSDTGGSSSSSLFFGGYAPGSPPPNGYFAITEQYNGTSWTELNDLNEAGSSGAGFGSATSAIMAGGSGGTRADDEVESWNGTSWTEVAELNEGRSQTTAAGSSGTAGIVFTGRLGPPGDTVNTETWNGSSWTEVANINTARDEAGGCGTSTAAMLVCGMKEEPLGPPSGWFQSNLHEQWDGSSWTETTETNESVSACVAIGHSSSGLKVAGTQGAVPAVQSKNEFWNGSSWTELADLSTARQYVSQAGGSASSGLLAGGLTGPSGGSSTTATEEWTSDLSNKTITAS